MDHIWVLGDLPLNRVLYAMSDWERILFTSFATIVGGTVVFLIGQILAKRSIEPCNELRKAISDVRFTLSYFAPTINTPIGRTQERADEAEAALREISARLFALTELTPKKKWLRRLSFLDLPDDKQVRDAAVQLRAIATYLHDDHDKAVADLEVIRRRISKVEALLKLESD